MWEEYSLQECNDVIDIYKLTYDAINCVISTTVEEIELTDRIPILDEVQDNKIVFREKPSIC